MWLQAHEAVRPTCQVGSVSGHGLFSNSMEDSLLAIFGIFDTCIKHHHSIKVSSSQQQSKICWAII